MENDTRIRVNIVNQIIKEKKKGKKFFSKAIEEAASLISTSERTIRRWVSDYESRGLEAIAHKNGEKDKRDAELKIIVKYLHYEKGMNGLETLKELVNYCNKNGQTAPSKSTVYRIIDSLKSEVSDRP
jgi:transposase